MADYIAITDEERKLLRYAAETHDQHSAPGGDELRDLASRQGIEGAVPYRVKERLMWIEALAERAKSDGFIGDPDVALVQIRDGARQAYTDWPEVANAKHDAVKRIQKALDTAPPPTEGDDPGSFVIWLCRECGWHVLDENSAGEGQPCEAHFIDPEIAEHGPTERVELVPAQPRSDYTERLEAALRGWESIGIEVRDALDLGLGAMRDREDNKDPVPVIGHCRSIHDALNKARKAHRSAREALDTAPASQGEAR